MNNTNQDRYRNMPKCLYPPLKIDPEFSITGVLWPPLVVEDVMYLSRSDASVEAREIDSGHELWRWQFMGQADTNYGGNSGTLLIAGEYLLAEFSDQLIVLHSSSGELLSTTQLDGATLAGAALSPPYVYLFRVDDDLNCNCRCWNFMHQSVLWDTAVNGFVEYITYHNDLVLLAPDKDRCLALNISDGTVAWEYILEDLSLPPAATQEVERVSVSSAIVPIGENYVFGLNVAHLVALSNKNGTLEWTQYLPNSNTGFFCYYIGKEISLLSGEHLYHVDPDTGVPLLALDIETALSKIDFFITGKPAVCENFIYVGSPTNGRFAAIDKISGAVAWSYKCKAGIPVIFKPVIAGRYLFVVDNEGNFYAFRSVL